MFDNIVKLLAKSEAAALLDSRVFYKLCRNEVTLEEAIRIFRKNNLIHPDIYIDPNEFLNWVRSLGYYSDAKPMYSYKGKK